MRDMKLEVNGKSHRYNSGKVKFSHIPPNLLQNVANQLRELNLSFPVVALAKLAEHYTLAELKYPNVETRQGFTFPNWAKGQLWESFLIDSALRHLYAKISGEDIDEDFGSEHLVAVAWCFASLYHYVSNYELYKRYDDRKFVGFHSSVPSFTVQYMRDHSNIVELIHYVQLGTEIDSLQEACLFGFVNTLIAVEFEDETLEPVFKIDEGRLAKITENNYGVPNVAAEN